MSWNEDAEKCPDEGKWYYIRQDLFERKESACNAIEIRRMQEAIDKVKAIAEEMHRFGSRHWMHYEGQTTRDFADRLDAAIKVCERRREMSYKPPPKIHLLEEDVEWIERVRRTIDGLAAHAEAYSTGCKQEWLAVEYMCRSLKDTVDGIITDYKERLGVEQK